MTNSFLYPFPTSSQSNMFRQNGMSDADQDDQPFLHHSSHTDALIRPGGSAFRPI